MIISTADRLKDVKAYYFVKKLEEIRQMIAEGKDVISFAIGSPDMAPSDQTVNALISTAQNPGNHGYQPYKGIPQLREALSLWYKNTYDVELDPNTEILPLMGSKEGILHVTLAFVNEGDKILVPNPGYPTYSGLSKLLGARIEYYELTEENNWYPNFDKIEDSDLSGVKIMWLNYPHMPTGTPPKLEVFEKAIAFGKRNNILICHDNPYSLVLNKEKPISILNVEGAKEVALEFNSFSKSHNMAGWRLGMLMGGEEYITNALRVKSNIDSGMFFGIQQAAIQAINNDEDWHRSRNSVYEERRKLVYQILDKLNFEYDTNQVGMFVWARPSKTSNISDVQEFIDKLLKEKHIFFTPGMVFGSNGNGYLRVSLCVPKERIEQALDRL